MKIVLVGGKTMGHISPLLGIGEALINSFKKAKIVYYGCKNSKEEEMVRKNPIYWFKEINVIGLNRKNPFKALKSLYLYNRAYRSVLKDFKAERPSIVISTGGFVSAGILKACKKLDVPYVLLEQNVCLGLTNKIYAKNAKYVFLSFEKTKSEVKNGVITGNPVLTKKVDISEDYILSIGGSLGANRINEIVSKIDGIKFITGKKDYINYIDNKNAIEYSNDLYSLMAKSKIIISRAGGCTIYEALLLNKPLILIPSPNVSNDHQLKNARYLEKNGCCKIILEENLNVDELKRVINSLTKEEIEQMKANQRKLVIDNPVSLCMKRILEVIYENILQ